MALYRCRRDEMRNVCACVADAPSTRKRMHTAPPAYVRYLVSSQIEYQYSHV